MVTAIQLSIVGFLLFVWTALRPVSIVGSSMEPDLPDGTRVLVTKAYWLFGPAEKGDEVVFHDPEEPEGSGDWVVKRIAYVGGETVPPEMSPMVGSGLELRRTYRVPKGELYLLGDNLAESIDSRSFGSIEPSEVRGKVVHVPGISGSYMFSAALASTGLLCFALAMAMRCRQ